MPRRNQQAVELNKQYKSRVAVDLGVRIRERRLELGLEQQDLRAKLELIGLFVARSEVSRWELGQALPDGAEIVALAEALSVSCGWLLNSISD